MKSLLLTLALLSASPALAQNQLQWRTTQCLRIENQEVVGRAQCRAGFAYDTVVRAIKIMQSNGWEYFEAGRDYVEMSQYNECLHVPFSDGTTQLICTEKSIYQLGIRGD